MGVLQFDGTDDRLEWGTLASALQNVGDGAWTCAAVLKRSTTSTTDAVAYLKSGTSPGTTDAGMTMTNGGFAVDVGASSSSTETNSTDVFGVVAGKSAGSSAPRGSLINLTAATGIVHKNMTPNLADATASDALEIGSWQDADPFIGHIGLVAFWEGNMSDANRALLFTNKQTSEFWTSAHAQPLFLAELNVAAASVTDLAGNASNPSHTGTSLDGAQTLADWNFDGNGEVWEPEEDSLKTMHVVSAPRF